jgi:predicted ATPase
MLSNFTLKAGSAPGQPGLTVQTPPSVTIFVGPNNSGKSQCLRELSQLFRDGDPHAQRVVVQEVKYDGATPEQADAIIQSGKLTPFLNERMPANHVPFNFGTGRVHYQEDLLRQALIDPSAKPQRFASWYLKHLTLNLDGANRINLLNPQSRGDLKNPSNTLARILVADKKREVLRKLTQNAFGFFFAVDAQQGDQLSVRFGKTAPPDERSFNDDALEYMGNAADLTAVSDGVKAFTGMLLELHAGDPKIIIVDEPEAFLHPSLAFKLGKELATGAATEKKHVFAATHSAQFLMGAILSGAKINIVRLTYSGGAATARLLPSVDLEKLMRDPLLRSVGVLSGLFYDYVAVSEADADRAFYQEINERLLAANDPRGTPNVLFLNADNKQTIPRIVKPLRQLGIPAAIVTDIDVLVEGGDQWTRHLVAAAIPVGEHQAYGTRRANALLALQKADSNFKLNGGIDVLKEKDESNFEAAENLFSDLSKYGVFVVPRGEVEAWLSSLDVSRNKGTWLRTIFEKMGNDPTAKEYVTPANGDVWDFLGLLQKWFVDPNRRGIPN